MKMEHVVKAPFAGSVRDVMVQAGDRVTLDQRLVSVEAEPE
jgi:biotin carboxyl carrier protein